MNVEKILRKIPMFKELELDTILFESKCPVLFTCKNRKDIYLFLCCLVNAKIVKWIGTKTNYDILIKLLQNKITIREAFLEVNKEKIVIEYDGQDVLYNVVDKTLVPLELLPTDGEYMDAEEDEYAEEIAKFEDRRGNLEFRIVPRINNYYVVACSGRNVKISDGSFYMDFQTGEKNMSDWKRISNCSIAYA